MSWYSIFCTLRVKSKITKNSKRKNVIKWQYQKLNYIKRMDYVTWYMHFLILLLNFNIWHYMAFSVLMSCIACRSYSKCHYKAYVFVYHSFYIMHGVFILRLYAMVLCKFIKYRHGIVSVVLVLNSWNCQCRSPPFCHVLSVILGLNI